MAFSSAVQRTVDNDKSPTGGGGPSAATGSEFFQRFPSLFPFILNELESAGASVEVTSGANFSLHPTLFPLLLLVSKFRPAFLLKTPQKIISSVGDGDMTECCWKPSKLRVSKISVQQTSQVGDDNTIFSLDLQLMLSPANRHCGSCAQHVRAVVARACSALTPLQMFPHEASQKILSVTEILQRVSDMKALSPISMNQLHGFLLQIYEYLSGLYRYISQNMTASSFKRYEASTTNAVSMDTTKPSNAVFANGTELLTAIHHDSIIADQLASLVSMVAIIRCPALHSTLLRISVSYGRLVDLRSSLLPAADSTEAPQSFDDMMHRRRSIILQECCNSLRGIICVVPSCSVSKIATDNAKLVVPCSSLDGLQNAIVGSPKPGEPLLWKEAMSELVYESLQSNNFLDAHQMQSSGAVCSLLLPDFSLRDLLSHIVSEVREGVLLGCIRWIDRSESDYIPLSKNALLFSWNFVDALVMRIATETEPPVQALASKLLCRSAIALIFLVCLMTRDVPLLVRCC
jgi:hypothetical protein